MDALKTAQDETNSMFVQRKDWETLTKNVPPAADRKYNLGDQIVIYSETEKEWIVTFDVVHVEGRIITVRIKAKKIRTKFNTFRIKPYFHDHERNIHH